MRCQLVDLAAAVYDELTMQPGALLAIRDGEHGSYIYTRPAPDAPIYMWLADASSREYEWFARVPAAKLERVADPTGAGNAYAGALTAQLAAGVGPEAAAATATAVGAAFCAADAWAPPDVDAATAWVQTASTRVAERIRVIVGGVSARSARQCGPGRAHKIGVCTRETCLLGYDTIVAACTHCTM